MYPQNLAQKLRSLPTTPFQHTVLKKQECDGWQMQLLTTKKGFSLHSNLSFFVSKALCNTYNIVYTKYEM